MGVDGESCLVCSFPATGVYFGVVACKACSIFFSRALGESRKYKCSHGGDCSVEKQKRIRCRSCRFQKCVNVGMKKELDDEGDDQASVKTILPVPRVANSPNIESNFAEIQIKKLADAYKNYINTEKSFYKLGDGGRVFSLVDEPVALKQEFLNKLEKASAVMIGSMLVENFEEFENLSPSQKKPVYGLLAARIMAMHSCYVTGLAFPERRDMKMCRHYGYFFDLNEPVQFFGKEIRNMTKICKLLDHTHQKVFNGAEKMLRLKMTESELGYMLALIVYNILDCQGYGTKEMTAKKHEITSHLYKHVLQKHGVADSVIKFSDILTLQLDYETISTSWTSAMITSMFDDHCSSIFLVTNETLPPEGPMNLF